MTDIPKELLKAVRSEGATAILLETKRVSVKGMDNTYDRMFARLKSLALAIVAERETRPTPTPDVLLKSMFEHGKDPTETQEGGE